MTVLIVMLSTFLLTGCTKGKTTPKAPSPTPTPRLVEIPLSERPYVSLIPRADGHELKLIIKNIKNITDIEYELLYIAKDEENEIEKGVGDSLKITGQSIERDLLLGTSSCTNGCKYKYDDNVHGGTLKLIFTTKNSQVATYETPFTLISGDEWKKQPTLSFHDGSFTIQATPSSASEFFVLIKNYGLPSGATASQIFSIFSSSTGKGKLVSVTPPSITPPSTGLSGNYLLP